MSLCSHEVSDCLTIVNTPAEGQRHHNTLDELCLKLTMGLYFNPCQCHPTPNLATHSSQRTSFSVIVPAGQDATLIYIGWTTQDFKYLPAFFKKSCTTGKAPGYQAIKLVDTRSSDSEEYVTGYMTCLVDLFKRSRLVRMDSTNDNISSDFTIGCIVDWSTGKISYTLNREHATHCDIKVCVVFVPVCVVFVRVYVCCVCACVCVVFVRACVLCLCVHAWMCACVGGCVCVMCLCVCYLCLFVLCKCVYICVQLL